MFAEICCCGTGVRIETFNMFAKDAALIRQLQQSGPSCWTIYKSDPRSLKTHLAYLSSYHELPPNTVQGIKDCFAMVEAIPARTKAPEKSNLTARVWS